MAFQIKKIFLMLGIISCCIYGQKNEFSDCMECINLNDSVLTLQCFDTLKSQYTQLEKMSLHYNFCMDSALAYLSSKSDLSSMEMKMIKYLRTGCQEIADEYQQKDFNGMTRDTFYFYKDKPFPNEMFLAIGGIALPVGIACTFMSIENLNDLKSKDYSWDFINAKTIDKTFGIIFLAFSCIIDIGGVGFTTFGTIKTIEENKKLDFLKNFMISHDKIKVMVDF